MAGELAFINGEIVPLSEAVIPVTDRAVMFGDSAFETLRAYGGRPFRLARHLERLGETCRILRMRPPISDAEIAVAIADLLTKSALGDCDAYVRVTVTGGPSTGPRCLERTGPQGIFIVAHELEPLPDGVFERGVSLAISGIKRNGSSPLTGIKSGNFLDSLFASQDARDRGQDDAVMLTTAGNLAEAPFSNIFMVKDGELLTPNIGCGFLPGITREAIIEVAIAQGVPVREITDNHETLMACDEAFLTSSIKEVMPVRQVGTRLLTFCPGPVTQLLREAFRELVSRETAA
ncbi:MAG: aminotransferase class IV [Candidatus Geothermincolia bacterium]